MHTLSTNQKILSLILFEKEINTIVFWLHEVQQFLS